jgi:hypothetical protein
MPQKIEMVGKVFGRLTVESFGGVGKNYQTLWNVVCSCGEHRTVRGGNLRNEHTRSCGCLESEVSTALALSLPKGGATTHGMRRTSIYRVWCGMKTRCTNPNDKRFKDYGGNGVVVCDRWLKSFENFFADMGERPTSKHSIGRTLDRGNYEPGNVFWMTDPEQRLARRNNNALRKWEAWQS